MTVAKKVRGKRKVSMRISHEEHIYEGSVKATVKTFFSFIVRSDFAQSNVCGG